MGGIFSKSKKSTGRLEASQGAVPEKADARDGLSSAPTGDQGVKASDANNSSRVHTAPPGTRLSKGSRAKVVPLNEPPPEVSDAKPAPEPAQPTQPAQPKEIKEQSLTFVIESANGPTASDADSYVSTVLGSSTVTTDLRSTAWAERVRGIEAFQQRVEAQYAPEGTNSARQAHFKASVTVLGRLLHDKVVPVYLPTLGLLVRVFSAELLEGVEASLPRAALAVIMPALLLRAGSSNTRAREESVDAITHLAHCVPLGGAAAVCPFVLQPMQNTKSQHAGTGRLELLHSLVIKFGFGAKAGLVLADTLTFTVPFCSVAAERTRAAAQAVLREAMTVDAEKTLAVIEKLDAALAISLKRRAGMLEEEAPRERVRPVPPGGTPASKLARRAPKALPPISRAEGALAPPEELCSPGAADELMRTPAAREAEQSSGGAPGVGGRTGAKSRVDGGDETEVVAFSLGSGGVEPGERRREQSESGVVWMGAKKEGEGQKLDAAPTQVEHMDITPLDEGEIEY